VSKQKHKSRVTLQAVADLVGVNRVTAAVALGRSPNGGTRVSEATRNRIIEAAQELHYAPNAIARALRGERTNIIGYYAGYEALDAYTPFTAAILQGLQQSCRAYKQDLMIFGSFERDTVDSIYATLTSGKIDGLVLLPTPHSPIMDRLFDSHLPVVALANTHPAIPSVVVDDMSGLTMVAEYLHQKGHRRVIFRARKEKHTSVARRQAAFLKAAAEFGLTVTITNEEKEYGLSRQEVVLLSTAQPDRPTVAVCWKDLSAYALLAQCQKLGLRVPEDLAIVGFDGVPLQIKPARQLTTVRAPWVEVAAQAVNYLLMLLDGAEIPHEITLPVELIVGDTA
jgi:DNA-binding LacI/PurR family transcriptional regulator